MAVPTRARRAFNAGIEADIRRLLREDTTDFWSQADLLQLFNENMDLRVLDLAAADEGWNVGTFKTSVVADQREYSLPEGAGRLKRLLWSVDDASSSTGSRETPMERNERVWSSSGASTDLTRSGVPTFMLEDNLIILEPTPSTARTNGLWIQCEYTPARLGASDKLDLRFPGEMETMLILDTAVAAMTIEGAASGEGPAGLQFAIARQSRYEAGFLQFIQDRSSSPVYTVPYTLGD